jgi:hypothetical protein
MKKYTGTKGEGMPFPEARRLFLESKWYACKESYSSVLRSPNGVIATQTTSPLLSKTLTELTQ